MLFHTPGFSSLPDRLPGLLLVRKNNQMMNIWLLIASYTFYGWWNPWYLLLLFGTSAIDYWMVLLMERKQSTRKLWLIISLVSNFGFLAYFKYAGFFTDNMDALFKALDLPYEMLKPVVYPNETLSFFGAPDDWLFTKVILPIGISFHTFQSMSYTIDAYFGSIKDGAQLHPLSDVRVVLSQLVAGPIAGAAICCRNYKARQSSRGNASPTDVALLAGFPKGGPRRLPCEIRRPGLWHA